MSFANTASSRVLTNGPFDSGYMYGPPGSFYFALFVAPTWMTSVDVTLQGWTFTGNYATNGAYGRFSGNYLYPAAVSIPGHNIGAVANFVVVGWSSNFGHNWAEVAPWLTSGNYMGAGYFTGLSDVVTNVLLGGGYIAPGLLFGAAPLAGSFTLWSGCLGPYWLGFTELPTNQTVALGAGAVFEVAARTCPAPFYQWYLNGIPIPGATRSSYQIASAQIADSGWYYAVLANGAWPTCCHTSFWAMLTLQGPPITPAAQTAETGSTAVFHVRRAGYPAGTTSWFFNGVQPLGSDLTNVNLVLTNLQDQRSGLYSAVLTTAEGVFTSAPAALSVIAPVVHSRVPAVVVNGQTSGPLSLEFAESMSALPTWLPLDTLDFTNPPQWYFDTGAPVSGQRFYRARQPGSTGAAPILTFSFTPALSLTGNIGNSIRIDYINQFGPINAWLPLATVTLTNTSQIYFDTSAIAQPPRLWRTVPGP